MGLCILALFVLIGVVNGQRTREKIDFEWRFIIDNSTNSHFFKASRLAPSPCTVPECKPETVDKNWRLLDLPHDFIVEGTFDPNADESHGYLPYGKGWYRKHFQIPKEWKGKTIWIDFDGIQRDSQIFLNGYLLGSHLSGYTSFRFQIGVGNTHNALVNYGSDNLLAIHVDATQPDSWWYDGGGIYRHVWLNSADPLYVIPWGVYVPVMVNTDTIDPVANTANAIVKAQVTVANNRPTQATFTLYTTISTFNGVIIGEMVSNQNLETGGNLTITHNIDLNQADLWSLEKPTLHIFTTKILAKGDSNFTDVTETKFGIRSLYFDSNGGFFLNKKSVKIKGMCNHQDFAGVGVAVPDSLQAYRITRMKEMGSNSWRTAHNPPNPELLDEADRQGFLVWDENHRNLIDPQWIEDLHSLVLRDRNHPSVIFWSICNEVLCENFNVTNAKVLKAEINKLDPDGGRYVSAAMNGGYDTGFNLVLDVMGFNYHTSMYTSYHESNPTQPIVGSETSSDYSDRGIYENDVTNAYVSAYDVNYPAWGGTAEDSWCPIGANSWMSGGFVWTGFDYKGEPTPYQWPNINSHFGNIDIAGFAKDNYYYYQSIWIDRPNIHVFPHWNWDTSTCRGMCSVLDNNGKMAMTVDVWVYTNADVAELFLNGISLGSKEMPKDGTYSCRHVNWQVLYTPGVLLVKGYKNGTLYATDSVVTTGAQSSLSLELEWPKSGYIMADNTDVALVTAKVLDSEGLVVPVARNQLFFSLSGPAKIIGLGNGDPSSHEADKPETSTYGQRSAFNGLARVVLQASDSPGVIILKVSSPGLQTTTLTFSST